MADKTLLIVDGHSYAYRAFFAIPKLTNARGEPTNAVFGFLKMLRKMADDFQPTHWTVAWDVGLPEERLKVLETYKAQRKPMPDDLRVQLPAIREVLDAMRVVSLEQPGFEADDVIASVCRQAGDARVLIATADKDLMQLVNDRVAGVRLLPKGNVLVDRDAVRERYGVPPEQMLDLLCLTGDSSDNIPGVPGVGEKTAAHLLAQFGGAEAVLARSSEVANAKLRAAIEQCADRIRQNRVLMTLNATLPVPVEWDRLRRGEPDHDRLAALFERFGFKSLLEETRRQARQSPQGQLSLG
ncbi:MAG: 5'-3' exonuclease H3TH domain-containing protein [Verrucomicrobiia bacterium]|jgi:DNA polymerase-1